MRKLCETADLFAIGGGVYGLVEVIWRGHTHWTMVLLGGTLFLLLGALDSRLLPRRSLLTRAVLGGVLITAAEFAAGCLLNRVLDLAVWDYSQMPFHLMGQVCLPYSIAWIAVAPCAQALYHACRRVAWNDLPRAAPNPSTPDTRAAQPYALHASADTSSPADDI